MAHPSIVAVGLLLLYLWCSVSVNAGERTGTAPDVGHYTVKNKRGEPCFLADLAATFKIRYVKTDNTTATAEYALPGNCSVAYESTCPNRLDGENQAVLLLHVPWDWDFGLYLRFARDSKTPVMKHFWLAEAVMYYHQVPSLFPDAKFPNHFFSPFLNNLREMETRSGIFKRRSFLCESGLTIFNLTFPYFEEAPGIHPTADLIFDYIQVQPFDVSHDKFAKEVRCPQDHHKSTPPPITTTPTVTAEIPLSNASTIVPITNATTIFPTSMIPLSNASTLPTTGQNRFGYTHIHAVIFPRIKFTLSVLFTIRRYVQVTPGETPGGARREFVRQLEQSIPQTYTWRSELSVNLTDAVVSAGIRDHFAQCTVPSNVTVGPASTLEPTNGSYTIQPASSVAPDNHTTPASTTVPLTSAAPPTVPPEPLQGRYVVKNATSDVCLLAYMALQFDINYAKHGHRHGIGAFNVPTDAVTSGFCGKKLSNISLSFYGGTFELTLSFKMTDREEAFLLSSVSLHYVEVPGIFPQTETPNAKRSASNKTLDIFRASSGKSYRCSEDEDFVLTANVTLHTRQVHVQAFGVSKGQFSAAEDCGKDQSSHELVAIVTGGSLAGVIIIVIVTYFVCTRTRRTTRSGYTAIN
ncbi:LAMP1 [Branchiostoma lanceolatum]|uniref:LAMP1 protein n=1 Tax=Branchiostoma lanceolatum TaxID=7740 RepID=A0A8K0EC76_BRALA|nr:LAMP1 [Branchiostoma lanceolatum]